MAFLINHWVLTHKCRAKQILLTFNTLFKTIRESASVDILHITLKTEEVQMR